MELFGYSLFIPRQTGKQLEALAEEVAFYTRKDWDAHDLGSAVLAEFIKIHRSESYKEIARIVTGSRKGTEMEDDEPRYKFFRINEN